MNSSAHHVDPTFELRGRIEAFQAENDLMRREMIALQNKMVEVAATATRRRVENQLLRQGLTDALHECDRLQKIGTAMESHLKTVVAELVEMEKALERAFSAINRETAQ